jgi:hypothetical protein
MGLVAIKRINSISDKSISQWGTAVGSWRYSKKKYRKKRAVGSR